MAIKKIPFILDYDYKHNYVKLIDFMQYFNTSTLASIHYYVYRNDVSHFMKKYKGQWLIDIAYLEQAKTMQHKIADKVIEFYDKLLEKREIEKFCKIHNMSAPGYLQVINRLVLCHKENILLYSHISPKTLQLYELASD